MTWQFFSVLPVWVIATAGALATGLILPHEQQLTWFAITLATSTIAAFWIQLAIKRKEGFVVRVMAAVGGSVVILGVATGIAALAG
jgi:hypothetical protein